MALSYLPLLAPLALLCVAIYALRGQGMRPQRTLRVARIGGCAGLAIAVISSLLLALYGPQTSGLIGVAGVGLSVRLDIVSVAMLLLVSGLGLVILEFSRNYLHGDPGQGRFFGWMAATLASVMLLVTAGNLIQVLIAWIAMSLTLHQLLVFYPERQMAVAAARKKAIFARCGDLMIACAVSLIVLETGTTDIATALSVAREGLSAPLAVAAVCLALAALLKSAQMPVHGWITQVMDAPTPVSALLHAGVVNAGGFLIIRFADLIAGSSQAMGLLAFVGASTAIVAGAVMLAQSAAKATLAWSTIAQMGFMLLQCGLGLFGLALLHILAHSAFKAHAFLSVGGAVEQVSDRRIMAQVAHPTFNTQLFAVLNAFVLYLLVAKGLGALQASAPAHLMLGLFLVLGVAQVLAAQGAVLRALLGALAVTLLYFGLQIGVAWTTAATLPLAVPTVFATAVMILFAIVALTLSFGQLLQANGRLPRGIARLRVHFATGLYLDQWTETFTKRA